MSRLKSVLQARIINMYPAEKVAGLRPPALQKPSNTEVHPSKLTSSHSNLLSPGCAMSKKYDVGSYEAFV